MHQLDSANLGALTENYCIFIMLSNFPNRGPPGNTFRGCMRAMQIISYGGTNNTKLVRIQRSL